MRSFTPAGIDTRQKRPVVLCVLPEKTQAISGDVFCPATQVYGTRSHDRPPVESPTCFPLGHGLEGGGGRRGVMPVWYVHFALSPFGASQFGASQYGLVYARDI